MDDFSGDVETDRLHFAAHDGDLAEVQALAAGDTVDRFDSLGLVSRGSDPWRRPVGAGVVRSPPTTRPGRDPRACTGSLRAA